MYIMGLAVLLRCYAAYAHNHGAKVYNNVV